MAANEAKVEAAPGGETGEKGKCAACGVVVTPDDVKKCNDTNCPLVVCDTHRNGFHHARKKMLDKDKSKWKALMDGPEETMGEFLVDYEAQCPAKG